MAASATLDPLEQAGRDRPERRSIVRRVMDFIFGYDFFISYAWRDGGGYARRLADRLEDEGFEVFLDRDDFARGDNWKRIGAWTLRRTGQLILVGSPLALTSDPVLHEVETFATTGRRILPIDFGGSLERLDASNPLSAHLPRELLRVYEDGDALAVPPSDEALQMIRQTFTIVRQDKKRLRVVGAVAAVLVVLAVAVAVSAVQAVRKADESASRLAEQRAFEAFVDWDTNPTRAFALAMEAVEAAPGNDRQRAVYAAMAHNLLPQQPHSVRNLQFPALEAAIADDGLAAVLSKPDGALVVDLHSDKLVQVELQQTGVATQYRQFMFSPDGNVVAAITRPAFSSADASQELRLWNRRSGRLIARSSISFGKPGTAAIAGFAGQSGSIFLEASHEEQGFVGGFVSILEGKPSLRGPLQRSPVRFTIGRVDLKTGLSVATTPSGSGTTIQILGLDGRPAAGWPAVVRPGAPAQAFLAPGGKALAIVEGSPDGSWKTTMLARGQGGPLPVGSGMETKTRPFIWDVTADGSAAGVIVEDALYPAEMWDFASRRRASLPLSRNVSSPFVMAAGGEHKVVDFVQDDSLVLVREPEEGLESQKLWLFDRRTLALRAMPHRITTDYAAARPIGGGGLLARLSRNGMLETWDLRASVQPLPRRLAIDDLVLSARFVDEDRRLVTISRVRRPSGYGARVDVWDPDTGTHQGRAAGQFSTRTKTAASADGRLLAAASVDEAGGTSFVQVWRLPALDRIRAVRVRGAIEALSFRKGAERLMLGGRDSSERAIIYDLPVRGEGGILRRPPVPDSQVHVAFSADGETLIVDYSYSSLALWPIGGDARSVRRFAFNTANGMPFDLAYDIVVQLKQIGVGSGGSVRGALGSVPVEVRPEGLGTNIFDASTERPLLTALERSSSRLYPVRGADLLDSTGRWFALASNSAPLANASYLRVYHLPSGYPVTGRLIHQFLGRPGAPWPQLWTERGGELDPVVALAFSAEGNRLISLTTDGILRRWPVLPERGGPASWKDEAGETSIAITGRRLVGGGAIEQRLADAEILSRRKRHDSAIREMRRSPIPGPGRGAGPESD